MVWRTLEAHFGAFWLCSTSLHFPKQLNYTEPPHPPPSWWALTVTHQGTFSRCLRYLEPIETRQPNVYKWQYHKWRAHRCEWEHVAGLSGGGLGIEAWHSSHICVIRVKVIYTDLKKKKQVIARYSKWWVIEIFNLNPVAFQPWLRNMEIME